MKVAIEPKTIPCRFAGPCSWRYFDKKCLHPKAKDAFVFICPTAYKVKN